MSAAGISLPEGLSIQSRSFPEFLAGIPEEKAGYAYAPGKWTIRQVLQHLLDAERIFAYRALRFARQDKTALPGFDENAYAQIAHAEHRSLASLADEFRSVRQSTVQLFQTFGETELEQSGVASGEEIYVGGIGFIIYGHVAHHEEIMRERYLEEEVEG